MVEGVQAWIVASSPIQGTFPNGVPVWSEETVRTGESAQAGRLGANEGPASAIAMTMPKSDCDAALWMGRDAGPSQGGLGDGVQFQGIDPSKRR